jgi:hypothetical protein
LIPGVRSRLDFESSRLQKFLGEAAHLLRGRSRALLSFDEVRSAARLDSQAYRGLREIPIDQIRGTVDRLGDFDASFLPVRAHLRRRWARLDEAMRRGEAIPPIEVYQVGEVYFVKDGHHRVSVARQLGLRTIQARVIEVRTRVPLTSEMDAAELLRAREYADFLERTRLDRVRPEASLEVSRLGRYDRMLEHILGHRYFLGVEQGREVPIDEAAASWYDHVYRPIIDLIRQYGILSHFPHRTEADLFLWIADRWLALSREGRRAGPDEAIADILFEQNLPQASAQLRSLLRRWLGPPRRFIQVSGRAVVRAGRSGASLAKAGRSLPARASRSLPGAFRERPR